MRSVLVGPQKRVDLPARPAQSRRAVRHPGGSGDEETTTDRPSHVGIPGDAGLHADAPSVSPGAWAVAVLHRDVGGGREGRAPAHVGGSAPRTGLGGDVGPSAVTPAGHPSGHGNRALTVGCALTRCYQHSELPMRHRCAGDGIYVECNGTFRVYRRPFRTRYSSRNAPSLLLRLAATQGATFRRHYSRTATPFT